MVILTREEWEKNWPNQQRNGHVWFRDGACNQQGTGAGICKYQSKIQRHISLGQDATAFQPELAAILDCVTSCLRKRLTKEQITICIDIQAAVVSLGANGTKLLLVAGCIEKLTALSEVNQVTIMWVPGCSGIQQNETADKLASVGARTRPNSLEPFLPLSPSKFKCKIRNNIGKRKQTKWRVCEKKGSANLFWRHR